MPYTPQCNGGGERANCTNMERVQCMLADAGVLRKYWAFAVSVAVHHKNCTPTQLFVGNTLYKAWHRRMPLLKDCRVFGCLVFVHIPKEKLKMLN